MTPKQMEQFAEIRRVLKAAYDDYFARTPNGHKCDEGFMSVSYPTIFDDSDYLENEAYRVEIFSYALGTARGHTFEKGEPEPEPDEDSTTVFSADPFAAALAAVKEWHAEQMSNEAR